MSDEDEGTNFQRAYETSIPQNAILEGKLESVRSLIDALSCIYSPDHKGQDVTITIHSEGGLRFSVEHTGCLQASVILPSSIFSTFRASDESLRLRLNLSLMMECLNLFGSGSGAPASVQLWHEGEGEPLVIRLWDGDADTVCKLTTLAFEEDEQLVYGVDLGFYDHEVVSNVVVGCDAVRDALSELDYCAASTAEIRIAPTAPRFLLLSPAATVASELDGLGEDALCTVELPDPLDRNVGTFQHFTCKRTQCGVYKLQHLQRCKSALALAETCRLQMNAEGMLSIVCKMRNVETDRHRISSLERCFAEFVIVAQEIDEDEEGEGDEEMGANEVEHEDLDEEVEGTPPVS